jgi:YHS domain-containing protein
MREPLAETIEEIEVDPVCGAIVDLDDAEQRDLALEYEGRSYTFCGSDCRSRFEQRPERYSAAGRAQP